MTTFPPPAIQVGLLDKEIADLRLLQRRHESWSRKTDDERVHKAQLRVASALEQTVFEMENNLMPALELIDKKP